MGLARQLKY